MKTFSVSLCLSIEANSKNEAIQEFFIKMNECAFDRDSLDVEEEKEENDQTESKTQNP